MDSMKFSPGDLGNALADDTVNIEGYDQSIDAIRARYPDETKTDEQQKLEDLFDPDSEINQGLLEELNAFDLEEGDLLTFPAHLLHRSNKINKDKRKTIISFNSDFKDVRL